MNYSNCSIPIQRNQSQNYDISSLAPQIIADVVLQLMPDRPIFSDSEAEIRFGNRGSFSVNKRLGAYRDYETGIHGGLLDMICHLAGFEERRRAFEWLRDNGYLDGSFTPVERPRSQPRSRPQATRDMFKVQELWDEATPVPYHQFHPVRRWCRHRNLFPDYKALPPIMRWHEQKHLIIVALAPIEAFVDAYPEQPQPRQFQLISIDAQGKKAYTLNGVDKRTYGQPDTTCVALFGDPNADEINICEGIADALALFARCPGTVIASLTTFQRLIRHQALVRHLTAPDRIVILCADNDEAGRDTQQAFARVLYEHGGDVFSAGR